MKYSCKGCKKYTFDADECPFTDCKVRARVMELPETMSAAKVATLLNVSRPTVLSRFGELEKQNLAYRDGKGRRIKREALLCRPLCDVPLDRGNKKKD